MKLSIINTAERPAAITLYTDGILEAANHSPLSISLIKAILDANVITEAEESAFQSLLNAGMAKLFAAISPGVSDDLRSMLHMRAGNKEAGEHAATTVGSMINNAKNIRGSILDDTQWWQQLFATSYIKDPEVQKSIIDTIRAEEQHAYQEEKAETPEAQPVDDKKTKLSGIIDKANKRREQLLARRTEIQNTISNMGPTQSDPALEHAYCELGLAIINESFTVNNCAEIQKELNKSLGIRRTLSEADFINKMTSAFSSGLDGARNYIANRAYAKNQLQNKTKDSIRASVNYRLAKLAAQLVGNHHRDQLKTILAEFGLDIRSAGQYLKQTQDIITKVSTRELQRTPEVNQRLIQGLQVMKAIQAA